MLNYIVAIIILLLFAIIAVIAFRKEESDVIDRIEPLNIESLSIDSLIDLSMKQIHDFLGQDLNELNLTQDERERKAASKSRMLNALGESAYGNKNAKNVIKGYIRFAITTKAKTGDGIKRVDATNIDQVIPFDSANELSSQDKFLILLQQYTKQYGKEGLSVMFDDFDFSDVHVVTDDLVNDAYKKAEVKLTYTDKLDYIVQKIFENTYGFSTPDALFETDLDEIDAGTSGIPRERFELTNKTVASLTYSYESIWVTLRGKNIHLACLSFGSQKNLIRACHNVYKYNAQKVFSTKNGYVISSMIDGSRVVVVRPPLSDKWAFFVRKFDSMQSIKPEDLIVGNGQEIPITLTKWFIRGQKNIAITGQQSTGKTTMLKSLCVFIENLNIRTHELAFELFLSYVYPDKNIMSLQETATVSAQEGMNLAKKLNGAVDLVGEVSEAEQASHIAQASKVASLFTMFSHHAKTTPDLIKSLAMNLVQTGMYNDMRDAIEEASKIVDFDIHLEAPKGYRHLDRISEVISETETLYPSEVLGRLDNDSIILDQREFYKRMTDRSIFSVREIVKYIDGNFVICNLPSPEKMEEIRNKLTVEDEAEFDKELSEIMALSEQIIKANNYVRCDGTVMTQDEYRRHRDIIEARKVDLTQSVKQVEEAVKTIDRSLNNIRLISKTEENEIKEVIEEETVDSTDDALNDTPDAASNDTEEKEESVESSVETQDDLQENNGATETEEVEESVTDIDAESIASDEIAQSAKVEKEKTEFDGSAVPVEDVDEQIETEEYEEEEEINEFDLIADGVDGKETGIEDDWGLGEDEFDIPSYDEVHAAHTKKNNED